MKQFLIVFFILHSILIKAQSDRAAPLLSATEISSIQIKKVNPKNALLQKELLLNKKQIENFVERWNTSASDTSEKRKPTYFLFVSLKNKSVKYFAVSGNQIDNGNNDCRSNPINESYFDKLWKSLLE